MFRVKHFRPLYVEPSGRLWLSRGVKVYTSDDGGRTRNLVGDISGNLKEQVGWVSRLAARFFRTGFHAIVPNPDGSVLGVVKRCLVKKAPGDRRFKPAFQIPRGSRPLKICQTPEGHLYFGEYFLNFNRAPIHIYGSFDYGTSWEIVYTFPAGEIRHVHSIVHDPWRDGFWILTGDENHESKILFTKDRFKTMETVFEGSQQVRALVLFPREDCLITATDTPLEPNYIQRLDLQNRRIEKICQVSGSVFYGCVAGRHMVISVAAEPSKVNTCKHASLLISRDAEHWRELYRQEKDIWQMPYNPVLPDRISEMAFLQQGVFVLPNGQNDANWLYAYGQALRNDDDCLLSWNLDDEWDTLSTI